MAQRNNNFFCKFNRFYQKVKRNLWLPFTFLAFIMILIGVMRGELAVVLSKAVKVCLECIGIG